MENKINTCYLVLMLWQSEVASERCNPNVENIICHDQTCTLQCESDGLINIISANYGRTDKHKCLDFSYSNMNCSTSMAMQKITDTCARKTSCVVHASNGVFGNPCPFVIKYVNLTYNCLENPHIPLVTRMTGILVAVVVVLVILVISIIVLFYRRLKLKKTDPDTEMNAANNINSRITYETMVNDQSDNHRYSKISPSSPKSGTCAEYSTCIPDDNCRSSRLEYESDYQEIDGDSGSSTYKVDRQRESYANNAAYFILDPNETGVKRCNCDVNNGANFILDPKATGLNKCKWDDKNSAYFILDPNDTGINRLKNTQGHKK